MREWKHPRGRYGGGNTLNVHFFIECLNVSLMQCHIRAHVSDLKNNHILEAEYSFSNHTEMNVNAFSLTQCKRWGSSWDKTVCWMVWWNSLSSGLGAARMALCCFLTCSTSSDSFSIQPRISSTCQENMRLIIHLVTFANYMKEV